MNKMETAKHKINYGKPKKTKKKTVLHDRGLGHIAAHFKHSGLFWALLLNRWLN